MRTFRDRILAFVPPWLGADTSSRFLYAYGFAFDALADLVVEGIAARFPDGAPPKAGIPRTPGALAPIGRDRRIVRGFDEPDAAYAERLKRWLDDWPLAGSPYALLGQIQGYLSGYDVPGRVVNSRGAWRSVEADGSKSYHRADPTNFDWSGELELVGRCWLILYPPADLWTAGPTVGDPELWGGAVGSPGYTVGSTATPEQVRTLRTIVEQWRSAFGTYVAIVLAFDPDSFDPTSAPGAPMPDGTWGSQTTNTGSPPIPARLASARYIGGT